MTATARHHSSDGTFAGIVGIGSDLTEVTRIKAVEEKKDQFMAVVSHELKSPLHGIIGLSESLSQGERCIDRKGRLRMVKSCAMRLLDLVSNIMQMSSLSRDRDPGGGGVPRFGNEEEQEGTEEEVGAATWGGKETTTTVKKDPVDIPSIINEVCVLVANATDKGNRPLLNPHVTFENRLGSNARLPIVEGDAYKITQVFYNVLTNACKFCSRGSITVDAGMSSSASASSQSGGGGGGEEKDRRLEVSIEDTGVGIRPENVKRIFEPFEQESNSSCRSFGGIGLGLAISKQVIKLHGGDVFVASTPGKGSKFVISLPVTKEAVELWASSSPSIVEDGSTPSTAERSGDSMAISSSRSTGSLRLLKRKESGGSKPIILSVDDDVVNQEVIRSALSDKYTLHVAMDGFEALEYFSTRSMLPDLLLLDVMMPGMDGFEVLKEIREKRKISPTNLPVIMLSAMEPVDKALIQSLKEGANDYVSKPFDPDILRARVSTAVETKRLRQIEDESVHYSKLLHDILPAHVVERLILGDRSISERHESVCILFSDIVGWTPMSESFPTQQLIDLLNQLFSEFDTLTEKHAVFKADTIGDAYIVVAGHEGRSGSPNAALRIAEFGVEMFEKVKSIKPPNGMQLQIRVGIHTGPAYSGVVGTKVPKYTFFGDTVNTAARLEQTGVPGCINMSNSCRQALAIQVARNGQSFQGWLRHMGASIVKRDPVKVKGKGMMELSLLCPKGVSPSLAKQLSNIQERTPTGESLLNASLTSGPSFENGDLLAREAKLKKEINRLEAANQASRDEVAILRLSLGQSAAVTPHDKEGSNAVMPPDNDRNETSARRHSYQPMRNMTQRKSETSRMSSLSSTPPFDASAHLREIEELKIQLLVTTKSLARTRQALLDKDDEIDELEMRHLLAKTQLTRNESQGSRLDLASTISASVSAPHKSSFIARTQSLLESSSHDPVVPGGERLSGRLDDLDDDFNNKYPK